MRLAAGLVLLCGVAVAGESSQTVQAFPGTTPVLDGRIDAAEWADASVIRGAQGWMSQMSPVRDANDLAFTVWVKHDGRRLYFAFRVRDDVLYGIDTPRWLPPNNAKAHELSREGWPWFGDEVEILLDSRRAGQGKDMAAGDGEILADGVQSDEIAPGRSGPGRVVGGGAAEQGGGVGNVLAVDPEQGDGGGSAAFAGRPRIRNGVGDFV